tara:strand:- start:433 stop:3105 length:2673 start_codon:yes stop_codon:yes gene_type:complete
MKRQSHPIIQHTSRAFFLNALFWGPALAFFGLLIFFGLACSNTTPLTELDILDQQVVGDCNVTLSAAPSSPQTSGTSITLTASATCISGTPEYKFYMRDTSGKWSLAQDWNASTTYTWNTSNAVSGTYVLQAWARRQGQTIAYEGASPSLLFEITGGIGNCTSATLSQNPISPQTQGTTITHAFSSTCTNGTAEYKLYHRLPSGTWSIAQDWSTNSSFAWDTSSESVGNHTFQLWVRAQGSTETFQAVTPTQTFEITAGVTNCSTATLSTNPTSPQIQGTIVTHTFSSTCTGGVTPEYKLYHRAPGGSWVIKKDWTSDTSLVWATNSEATGTHQFQLWVRAQGSTDAYQGASSTLSYELTATTPSCNTTSLSASPISPQMMGTSVTLSFSSTCVGGGSPEYKLYAKAPIGAWVIKKDWTTSTSFAWDTNNETVGIHYFQLWVRAQGSSDAYQAASSVISYELTTPTSWVQPIEYGSYDPVASIKGHTVDPNGNIIVNSHFQTYVSFGSYQYSVANQASGFFITKLNPNGNWLWARQLAVTPYGIATDSSSDIYISGYFSGTVTLGSTNLTSTGNIDIFVAKMDTNGNWLWAKKAGGTSSDSARNLKIGPGNTIYITGYYGGSATFGSTTLTSTGNIDIFVAKMDSNGNWLWAKHAGSSSVDESYELAVDNSGNAYIAGTLGNTGSSFGSINPTFKGNYLAKINNSGIWQWVKSTGDTVKDLTVDSSANIYVAGTILNQTSIKLGSTTLTRVGTYDAFWAKADTNGNWLWAKSVGSVNGVTEALGITVDSNSNAYSTGRFNQNITFGSTTLTANDPGSTYDIFVSKMDSSEAWIFAQKAGGNGGTYEEGRSIKFHNGNLYSSGIYRGSATFGSLSLSTTGTNGFVWMFPAP